jgi:hypothetical protein
MKRPLSFWRGLKRIGPCLAVAKLNRQMRIPGVVNPAMLKLWERHSFRTLGDAPLTGKRIGRDCRDRLAKRRNRKRRRFACIFHPTTLERLRQAAAQWRWRRDRLNQDGGNDGGGA